MARKPLGQAKRRRNHEGSISQRPDGRWQASVMLGRNATTGRPTRLYFYGDTREEAAAQLRKAVAEYDRGAMTSPSTLTITQWGREWLDAYKKPTVRVNTFDVIERAFQNHLVPTLGRLKLKDLRVDQVQRWIETLLTSGNRRHGQGAHYPHRGLSPKQVRGHVRMLSEMLERAVEADLIPKNVARIAQAPKATPSKVHPLNMQEVDTLLAYLKQYPTHESPQLIMQGFPWQLAIQVLLYTGVRREELFGLRWQDLHVVEGYIAIEQAVTPVVGAPSTPRRSVKPPAVTTLKTAASRRKIPVPSWLLEALRRYKVVQAERRLAIGVAMAKTYVDHDLIFCKVTGELLEPAWFWLGLKAILARAGLPLIRTHDFRHTFAQMLYQAGESVRTIQLLLGHTSLATTDLYLRETLGLDTQNMQMKSDAITRLDWLIQEGKSKVSGLPR